MRGQQPGDVELVVHAVRGAQPGDVHVDGCEHLWILANAIDEPIVGVQKSHRNRDFLVVVGAAVHEEQPDLLDGVRHWVV